MKYEVHYTGIGYPSMKEIETEAKKKGFTHSFWAGEFGYKGMYNGDSVVVYNSIADMPEGMKEDAKKIWQVNTILKNKIPALTYQILILKEELK